MGEASKLGISLYGQEHCISWAVTYHSDERFNTNRMVSKGPTDAM
jgi:hypothetical protein